MRYALLVMTGLCLGVVGMAVVDSAVSREAASLAQPQIEKALLPPIAPLTAGEVGLGGFVTRLSNVVQPNGEPFRFDHVVSGDLWDPEEPSVLVVPATGWWRVGVDLTTLGTSYDGPPNNDVTISVVRNWDKSEPFLTSTVAVERFHNDPDGRVAEINSLLEPVWLEAGDRLEVILVGGPEGLLVESNPSDGVPNGFRTDTGPGTLSPHFFLLPL